MNRFKRDVLPVLFCETKWRDSFTPAALFFRTKAKQNYGDSCKEIEMKNLIVLLVFSLYVFNSVFAEDDVVTESVKSVGNLVIATGKSVGAVLETAVKTFNPEEGNKGYVVGESPVVEAKTEKATKSVMEEDNKFSSQKYKGKLTLGTYEEKSK